MSNHVEAEVGLGGELVTEAVRKVTHTLQHHHHLRRLHLGARLGFQGGRQTGQVLQNLFVGLTCGSIWQNFDAGYWQARQIFMLKYY